MLGLWSTTPTETIWARRVSTGNAEEWRRKALAVRASAVAVRSPALRELLAGMADALEAEVAYIAGDMERRADDRVPATHLRARLMAGSNTRLVQLLDLSTNGAAVAGQIPWPLGAEIAFQVVDEPIRLPAHVVWCKPGLAGLFFFHGPGTRLLINQMLARLRRRSVD
jgi:PilZ domain